MQTPDGGKADGITGVVKSVVKAKKAAQKLAFLGCFLVVEAMGVEPMSERRSAWVSPGAGDLQHSLRVTPVARLTLQ